MKKSIGIFLALVLVIGTLFVPVTLTASAEETPTVLTAVDYIETNNFTSAYHFVANNATTIYYPGVETTVTHKSGGYFNAYACYAVFTWDTVNKTYVFDRYVNAYYGDTNDVVIPEKGFIITVYDSTVQSTLSTLSSGTKAYLYGIDLFEETLDSSLDKSVYTTINNSQTAHTADGYSTNAKIVINAPLAEGTPFNPEYVAPDILTTVDYIETNNFTSAYHYVSNNNATTIYYSGSETTVTKGSNCYFGTWASYATFTFDSVNKTFVFDSYTAGGAAGTATIPEKGFLICSYNDSVNTAMAALNKGTPVYLYGIDLFEETLDSTASQDDYRKIANGSSAHTAAGYSTNAKIVLNAPLSEGTPFIPVDMPKILTTVDYIETDKFNTTGHFVANATTLYYPGKETTLTHKSGGYFNAYTSYAIFTYDSVNKNFAFETYVDAYYGNTDDVVIPEKGFLITAYDDTLKATLGSLSKGTKVYLYGIDFYESYLDSTAAKEDYTHIVTSSTMHTQDGYVSNAKIVIENPLDDAEAFNLEQQNIALEELKASVLTGEAFLDNGEVQALRVYSGYTLNRFDKVFYNGAYKEIVARGIIYTPTTKYSADTFKVENVNNSDVFGSEIVLNETTDCWLYDEATNTTVFSNYFINYTEEMYKDTTGKYSMTFASYIVLDDGTTVVSPASSFDVNALMLNSGDFGTVL